MPKNDKHKLSTVLTIFQNGRNRLVENFLSEEPLLYSGMFSFEPKSSSMQLAIDKYFFTWLVSHPEIYSEILQNDTIVTDKSCTKSFIVAYRELCQKFLNISNDPSSNNETIGAVLQESIEFIDKLLDINTRDSERIKRLCYEMQKSKYIYEKQFHYLKEGDDGNS